MYLEPEIVEKLKTKAERRGLGYLTLMRMIVYENSAPLTESRECFII